MASENSSLPSAPEADGEAADRGGEEEGLKITRSSSHSYGDQRSFTPLGRGGGGGGGGLVGLGGVGGGAVLPPVLVLYHPTMEAMAKKLVEATTRRVDRLKLQQNVILNKKRSGIEFFFWCVGVDAK